MDRNKVSVVERQGRRYGYAGGAYTGTGNPSPTKMVGSTADGGVPSRHALQGEIVEPWEDVERMCSMNQERRRMREALVLNRAQMQAAQEAQRVRDRKARRRASFFGGLRMAVTLVLAIMAMYFLLLCLATQAGAYGLGAAASLLIGGRVCG